MNYSKYRFNLDMQSYISQISLPVRQHDTGIVLRINLTDGGVPYVIRDGCRAVFYARKSDENPLMNDCIIEKNTTICYELTQQTTSCSGVVDCEVRLYGSDGNLITTPRFILVIDSRVVHDEDFPLSEAEQTVLDNIILSEQKRQKNEEQRAETYEKMLDTVEKASTVADTLTEKLATGDYNGITPHVGDNGNWWFDDEDSGVLARGVTPHIGTNGNWWFDNVDTGVKADAGDHQHPASDIINLPTTKFAKGTVEPVAVFRATGGQREYFKASNEWNDGEYDYVSGGNVMGDEIAITMEAMIVFDFKPSIIFFGNSHATFYIWGEEYFYATDSQSTQTYCVMVEPKENADGTFSLKIRSDEKYVGGDASTTPPTILDYYWNKSPTYPTFVPANPYLAIGEGGISSGTGGEELPIWQGGSY